MRSIRRPALVACLCFFSAYGGAQAQPERLLRGDAPDALPATDPDSWVHFVRIAGHPLSIDRVDEIIESATRTHVFGIETDNDIPGRYESFLDPREKLAAIHAVAEAAHEVGNRSFVYVAGLEIITANADEGPSFLKDHPGWVQRDIDGRPALFGADDAFWIDEGEEDVWISPFAKEWREIYMERIRQIAATGIDGVYVDIPYWMTHFEGWWDTWASFDDHTVAAFTEKTGLAPPAKEQLGNFDDPTFRAWVEFRIQALTDFMAEIDANVKQVDPDVMTIAEVYPGIGEDAVRVGADVYQMYEVVDAIAHEYSAGAYMAAARSPADWFTYMTGMHAFRAFAEKKPSWMLSYSWDGQGRVEASEAMKNLAMTHVMAGTNTWDAHTHIMSRSNDYDTRAEIFGWIGSHEDHFYRPRRPIEPVGVYFSPKTRNFFTGDFVDAFTGIVNLLQQAHRPFQIVTPRTLASFGGPVLVLPDVRILEAEELRWLEQFAEGGGRLVITGESGWYDRNRVRRTSNPLHAAFYLVDAVSESANDRVLYLPQSLGRRFLEIADEEFNERAQSGRYKDAEFYALMTRFAAQLDELGHTAPVTLEASPFVASTIAEVEGRPHVYVANFGGLRGEETARQRPERGARVHFEAEKGTKVFALPFLGKPKEVASTWKDGVLSASLPEIEKGLVVWVQE